MKLHLDQVLSFEEINERISSLEETIGTGEVSLVNDENVKSLQDYMQHYVADSASELMTGMRWRRERQEYLLRFELYKRLLGAVALDSAYRTYAVDGDMGSVKQEVFGYLQDSKQKMVSRDYEMRLQKSSVEQGKQWLAQHPKQRFLLPIALSAATTTTLFKASEASTSMIDLTTAQGGLMGVMTLMGAMAIRSVLRSGPHQVGSVLKNQFNASLKTYMLDDAPDASTKEVESLVDSLPEKYAARHLTEPFGAAAIFLVNYDIDSQEDFKPMVEKLLAITEASLHESYGITLQDKEAWYRKWAAQTLRIDLAS